MKQQILKKIDELISKNARLWNIINQAMEDGDNEYDSDVYGGDFYNYYGGDSLSHILDILDEREYILKKLANFIQSLEE